MFRRISGDYLRLTKVIGLGSFCDTNDKTDLTVAWDWPSYQQTYTLETQYDPIDIAAPIYYECGQVIPYSNIQVELWLYDSNSGWS